MSQLCLWLLTWQHRVILSLNLFCFHQLYKNMNVCMINDPENCDGYPGERKGEKEEIMLFWKIFWLFLAKHIFNPEYIFVFNQDMNHHFPSIGLLEKINISVKLYENTKYDFKNVFYIEQENRSEKIVSISYSHTQLICCLQWHAIHSHQVEISHILIT